MSEETLKVLNDRLSRVEENIKSLTELVAKLSILVYSSNEDAADPVDYDDSLIK